MSKDIKKALEHCVEWNCGNCPNRDELGSGEIVCRGRLLPEVLEYVSDLEVKLAESENQCRECKHLNKKIELNIKNKLMTENCELQKQLAEKERQLKLAEELLIKQEKEYDEQLEKQSKIHYRNLKEIDQYKISFAIAELEKVKEHNDNLICDDKDYYNYMTANNPVRSYRRRLENDKQ